MTRHFCHHSPLECVINTNTFCFFIVGGGGGGGGGMGMPSAGAGGGNAFDDYGGVDPSMDPELAMAIRASTEEARAQEEARVR